MLMFSPKTVYVHKYTYTPKHKYNVTHMSLNGPDDRRAFEKCSPNFNWSRPLEGVFWEIDTRFMMFCQTRAKNLHKTFPFILHILLHFTSGSITRQEAAVKRPVRNGNKSVPVRSLGQQQAEGRSSPQAPGPVSPWRALLALAAQTVRQAHVGGGHLSCWSWLVTWNTHLPPWSRGLRTCTTYFLQCSRVCHYCTP